MIFLETSTKLVEREDCGFLITSNVNMNVFLENTVLYEIYFADTKQNKVHDE